jgi:hypothetical protein
MMTILDQLADTGSWTIEDARSWWSDRAPGIRSAVHHRRRGESTPGPRTVAIDLERRS